MGGVEKQYVPSVCHDRSAAVRPAVDSRVAAARTSLRVRAASAGEQRGATASTLRDDASGVESERDALVSVGYWPVSLIQPRRTRPCLRSARGGPRLRPNHHLRGLRSRSEPFPLPEKERRDDCCCQQCHRRWLRDDCPDQAQSRCLSALGVMPYQV
jgi:hypothetical protein